jgi:hypothetical protein
MPVGASMYRTFSSGLLAPIRALSSGGRPSGDADAFSGEVWAGPEVEAEAAAFVTSSMLGGDDGRNSAGVEPGLEIKVGSRADTGVDDFGAGRSGCVSTSVRGFAF